MFAALSYAVPTSEPASPWLLIAFGCGLIGMGVLFVRSDVPGMTGFIRFRLGGLAAVFIGLVVLIVGVVRAT